MKVDYKNPDYAAIYAQRTKALKRLRKKPELLPAIKDYYRANPADFISDWGVTSDPRLVERGLPSMVPFVLWPKQREWIDWVIRRWRAQKPGLSEKSRDWGLSWLSVTLGATLCLFYEGLNISYGSRKEEYVDKIGHPKALFPKARMFVENLPAEFRGTFETWRDAPHMRLTFPDTGSTMTGEAGDQIGRGDRASIAFVDESAYLARPMLVEHSLSQTTNCRMDISSVNGMNNPFAQKRHNKKLVADPEFVFICDWRDDPRKDDAWYAKQVDELDPVTVAQEIDRDYSASVEGIVIPGAWVRAAIDAAELLGIAVSGRFELALDVADEGVDKNALCGGRGIEISVAEEWSGKESDPFYPVQRAFGLCDELEVGRFRYDADGIGALVRGDARVINEQRTKAGQKTIAVEAYRGSAAVFEPEGEDVKGRKNVDYFENRKAQDWWVLRRTFQRTYRWVTAFKEALKSGNPIDPAKVCSPDEIISISSKMPNYLKLVAELSQPTYKLNGAGKIVVDKAPDGMRSPNLADGVMMRRARAEAVLRISDDVLKRVAQGVGRHMPKRRRR